MAAARLLMSEASKKVLRKVEPSLREDVEQALKRFVVDPMDTKLRFEKYKGFDNLYTIRANYSLRIYMADDGGMAMQIVHVGNHDYVRRIK